MGEFDGWEYSVTDLRDGGIVIPLSAIQLFHELNAIANQRTLTERERRALDRAYQDARSEWESLTVRPPKPNAPKPRPRAAQPPPKDTKPVVKDTPQDLAAPDVQEPAPVEDKAVVDRTTQDAPISRETSGDAHWGQYSRKPVEQVASMVTPPPTTDADRAKLNLSIARNEPTSSGEPHPTHSEPFSQSPSASAEPVDLFTGAFVTSFVDLVVPGAVADITFERSYRSGRPYYGPFGFGWDHAYNVYLRRLNDGSLALWNGRLREQRFLPAGSGWVCEPAMAATIETRSGIADGFEITHPGGVRWQFERPAGWGHAERIPLVAIVDRHGNAVKLTYDTRDDLVSVLDEAGRGLRLEYGQCGLVERISDHSGSRTVRYDHHDEIEHLSRVILPATAQYPAGVETRYDYDMYADHPAMRHNIVRVTDADGRIYVENEYAGPEAGWAFNTVHRQFSGGFEYLFEYEQIQWVPPDELFVDDLATRTSVGLPDGTLHVYTFNYRGDLLDHRFRLYADGSYRVVSTQWTHDAHGNVTEIVAPDGGRTMLTYDVSNLDARARHNLLRVELFAPLPAVHPSRVIMRAQYDPHFQLPTRIQDEAGEETRLIYDFDLGLPGATGRLSRTELPPVTLNDGSSQQSVNRFEHDSRGLLTARISPGGSRTEFQHVTSGVLAGFIQSVTRDATGSAETTTYAYDAAGFQRRVIRPDGAATELLHNALGQVEEIVLPEVDGVAPRQRTWFGSAGAPVRIDRPRGDYADAVLADPVIRDELEYDALGRFMAARSAVNTARRREVRLLLDADGRAVSTWDPAGTRTDRVYDERGLLLRETRGAGTPDAATTRRVYDRAGRLLQIDDPAGRITRMEYDVWGRPIRVDLPGGATERYTWGVGDRLIQTDVEGSPGLGLPVQLLAREGSSYDERGRLLSQTKWVFAANPAAAQPLTTRFGCDVDDNQTSVRLPGGGIIRSDYDGLSRVTRTEDPFGNLRHTTYDAGGRRDTVTLIDVDGSAVRSRVFSYEYDARSRLRTAAGPAWRTEFDYDARDALVEQREPGGVTTRFRLGAHGEVEETLVDPGGLDIRSRWTYDEAGRLVRYTDPAGEATTWDRDALGRVRRTQLGDGSTWLREYDRAGRIAVQTMPSGGRVQFEYAGPAASPSRISVAGAAGLEPVPVHTFIYDALERLVRAGTPGSTVERRYDSLGRTIEETAFGSTVRTEHNVASQSVNLFFPDGRCERTEHDALGRPIRVVLQTAGALGGVAGTELVSVAYTGMSSPKRITCGNGVETACVYDDASRLIRLDLVDRSGTLIDSVRVRHDGRGRRAVVQSLGPPGIATYCVFDTADRLRSVRAGLTLPPLNDVLDPALQAAAIPAVAAAATSAPVAWSYDLNDSDDRLQQVPAGGGPTLAYGYEAGHRLASIGAQTVTHHRDGHRATDGRFEYDVDALGRLVRVRDAGTSAVRVEFRYDAVGRAAAGVVDGVTFERSFAGVSWIHERRGATAEVRQLSPNPLGGVPLCVTRAAGTTFLHGDAALSTLCATNASGAVRQRYRFGPFGEAAEFAADGVTPLGVPSAFEPVWRGMPIIPGVGLYETPRRLYDPGPGAFLARDPMLYGDSPSPYVYAGHNPIDFADPTGQDKAPVGQREWIETPKSEIDRMKMHRVLTYDLPPDDTGFKGEDYLGYAFVYGLKASIYKPIKSWILDERPKYLDKDQNVRTTSFKPDRSAELSIAFGQIAQFLLPTPKTVSTRGLPSAQAEATMSGGTKLTFLENDIEVAYGSNYTRIGTDGKTMRVTEARQPWPNTHDVIVHSEAAGGRFSPGVPIAERPYLQVIETHEAQIAEAIRMNPNLRPGQPIRAISCALSPEQAQALANLTGHPVYASPLVVGVKAGPGVQPVQQFIRWEEAVGTIEGGRWTNVADTQVWNLYMPK